MFKKTRNKLRATIEAFKAAFALFIVTVENLTREVASNTSKVEALAAEQKELQLKFDLLVDHTQYLAAAKRNELQRQGHKV